MEHLWRAGEGEVLAIHAAVARSKDTSVNTIGSALERLHKKGLLSREKVSHAYRYKPALSRDKFLARRLAQAAGSAKNLAGSDLMASFLDVVSSADHRALDELERLIALKRQEGK